VAEVRKVDIKTVCKYNGHSIKANEAVDLSLKFGYDQLVNYIQLVQLLNENINIISKIGDSKPIKLGIYTLKEVKIDNDGEAVIKFNSTLSYVEADNLNKLAGEMLKVRFKADVEIENDGEDED